MKCVREDLKAHITDVLVGEAEPALKTEVLAHLATCASCQADREQMEAVLGLLKEAPPWVDARASASADADALSMIQRQKIESLAARRSTAESSPSSKKKKDGGFPSTWLALAASLSAVGIALVLARRGAETQLSVESPAPVATSTLGPNQLAQAPEAPELAELQKLKAAKPESMTTPAGRRDRAPSGVDVSPEAMREFKRQAQSIPEATVLDQATEKNEYQGKKDSDQRLRDEQGTVAGGLSAQAAPGRGQMAQTPPPPPASQGFEQPKSVAPVPPPQESRVGGAAGASRAAAEPGRQAEIDQLRKELSQSNVPNMSPTAEEARQEVRATDALKAKVARLRELEGDREAGSLGFSERSRRDLPAPPAAAPQPRDMFFESKGTNPFIVTEEDPQATFGMDVDTASYTLTRNYLNRGTLPPAAAVRVEEFVNAFPNNVAAERGRDGESAFAVRVDGAPNPLHPGYHVIRVAMKAKEVDPRERKPAHLTFVIDVSGSMAAENRLELVKRSLALLVDKLDERDTIGIVVYGTNGRRMLTPTSVANRDRILSVINGLRTEGSTNLEAGLDLGYEMAMESFQRGTSNRVVLCTDGVANTGQTEANALLSRIRNEAKRGIDMMALGFGMGNYNDALLQRLADEGNGQYAYIDDIGEARAFFLRKLTSVLEVVARDAKTQVEFNPARVERYRLLGYEKRDVADRDFRNDAVDAGEINSGHSVTALFEVKLRPGGGKLGVARIRYKTGPRSEGVEFSRDIVDDAVVRSFDQATPAFRTAFIASRFAEHLRKSYWVKDESLGSVLGLAEELPDSTQTNELTELIRKATRLIRPQVREDW